MKVKLATQVLSQSVTIALEEIGNDEVMRTAQFFRMMNDYFDCTNVRSPTEHIRKRNDLIKPYTSVQDTRFQWLMNVFLQYLDMWKKFTLETIVSDVRQKSTFKFNHIIFWETHLLFSIF